MRQEISFSEGWLFYDGDIDCKAPNNKATVYNQAKTECRRYGPAARVFNESAFQSVSLPHDALIANTPKPGGNPGTGYFRYHSVWYRKHFMIPAAWKNGRVSLYFEGAATHADVYVNGCLAARSVSGYAPFEVDISDFVLFEEDNTVSVYLDSESSTEGWWYQGLGIYRDVTLVYTENMHIARDGIFVSPVKGEEEEWSVPVSVEIANAGLNAGCAEAACEILDENGLAIDSAREAFAVSPLSSQTVRMYLRAVSPEVWDVWNAHMYTLRVSLYQNEAKTDEKEVAFGFRTFRFDADEGFILNGRRVEICGVNLHQDFSLTGKAMPEDICVYRLKLLKEMGVNACRMSHYPRSAFEMDALDRAGMLVMAETRWFSTEESAMRQWEALIRRDRNHPGVILWSCGNEEDLFTEERGAKIASKMFARARLIDPSRPYTAVVDKKVCESPVFDVCDVISVNYNLKNYDAVRANHPDKPFLAGEWCAAPTSRGWYQADDESLGRAAAYDHDPMNGFSASREFTHTFVSERPYVAGGFQWAGCEYRGECLWPRLSSISGAIDLFLFRKDAFYQNQSHMLKRPMIHLLPHWNAPENGSDPVRVWAYTNCETAELFVNGESMGIRKTRGGVHAEWLVPYQPGEIRAMGMNNGIPVCGDSVKTTGAPKGLRITRNDEEAWLFTCECIDEEGNPVPDASPLVRFYAEGMKIIGTGSDNADPVPPASHERKMYMGKIAVYARPQEGAECLRLFARADGLESAEWILEYENKNDQEALV